MRLCATTTGERVVRVRGDRSAILDPADWQCFGMDAVAFPADIAGHRRVPEFDEVVFAADLTAGARYTLRAGHRGPEVVFRGYESPGLASKRLNLWRQLPEISRRIDSTGDLKRFLACLQDILDLVTMRVGGMSKEYDSRTCTTEGLQRILADQGNPFAFALPGEDGRRLATVLIDIYRQKGTGRGICNAIRLFLGLEVAEIRCHIITKDDDGIIVGGASRSSIYAFDVAFGQPISTEQRERVRSIVEYLKPAHTHLVDILAPSAVPAQVTN